MLVDLLPTLLWMKDEMKMGFRESESLFERI